MTPTGRPASEVTSRWCDWFSSISRAASTSVASGVDRHDGRDGDRARVGDRADRRDEVEVGEDAPRHPAGPGRRRRSHGRGSGPSSARRRGAAHRACRSGRLVSLPLRQCRCRARERWCSSRMHLLGRGARDAGGDRRLGDCLRDGRRDACDRRRSARCSPARAPRRGIDARRARAPRRPPSRAVIDARTHVERAAEDAGKRKHVVDLVRVVGAARSRSRPRGPRSPRGRSRGAGSRARRRSSPGAIRSMPARADRARHGQADEDVGAGEHLVGAARARSSGFVSSAYSLLGRR